MSEKINVTGRQIAAARALLTWDQPQLAERASISVPTLKRMEASQGLASGMTNNVRAVVQALEAAGISFLDRGEDGGHGVRYRHRNQIGPETSV